MDVFRYHLGIDQLGELCNRLDDLHTVFVRIELFDVGAVYFYIVNLEIAQAAEVGGFAAKIIEGDLKTDLFKPSQLFQGIVRSLGTDVLQDLQCQAFGLDPEVSGRYRQELGEIPLLEVIFGDINRKVFRAVSKIGTAFFDHCTGDMGKEADEAGRLDKMDRCDDLIGILQPGQALILLHFARIVVDNGLEIGDDHIILKRVLDLFGPLQVMFLSGLEAGAIVVDLKTVLADLAGLLDSRMGMDQGFFMFPAGDTDRAGQVDIHPVDEKGVVLDFGNHIRGKADDLVMVIVIAEIDKLVSVDPEQRCILRLVFFKKLRHGKQDLVAEAVAVGGVEVIEVVDIAEENGMFSPVCEQFIQLFPAIQAGQFVGKDFCFELFGPFPYHLFEVFLVADVLPAGVDGFGSFMEAFKELVHIDGFDDKAVDTDMDRFGKKGEFVVG